MTEAQRQEPPDLSTIRTTTYKDRDAWWTVFVVDPIAARALWLVMRVRPRLSPMTVTSSSLVLGLAAAVLFGRGWYVAAAVIFQLSFLADCVDGKLARLTGRASLLGAFYDGFVNHAVYVAALVGLAVHAVAVSTPVTTTGIGVLLALRSLTIYTNRFMPRPARGWASAFTSRPSSWMARHRLLPPFSFPDKQFVLFLLGPVVGLVWLGVAINLVLELGLLARKVRRAVPTLADRKHATGWDEDLGGEDA